MSDREESPDWLRSFEPPTQSTIQLSSDSDLASHHSPVSDDEDGVNLSKLFKKDDKVKPTPEKKRKNEDYIDKGKRAKGSTPEKHGKPNKLSSWSLSSDSESSQDDKPTKREVFPDTDLATDTEHKRESPKARGSKVKSPTKQLKKENDTKDNSVKEENGGRHNGHQGSSSRVPLLLSDKVQRSKALVECDGDSIDLSGDAGSVGRIVILDDPSKNNELFLDLKGTIYKTTIVPSRTFCVVSFGQSEAKIEAIMNDYIQLKPQSNVYEAETMVEGTLEGFSFDSEEEADKTTAQPEQEDDGEQLDGKKTKGKPGKASGPTRKKGKPAGGKPPKKAKKKPQASKKGKTKK